MAAASGHLALKWRMAVSAGDLDLAQTARAGLAAAAPVAATVATTAATTGTYDLNSLERATATLPAMPAQAAPRILAWPRSSTVDPRVQLARAVLPDHVGVATQRSHHPRGVGSQSTTATGAMETSPPTSTGTTTSCTRSAARASHHLNAGCALSRTRSRSPLSRSRWRWLLLDRDDACVGELAKHVCAVLRSKPADQGATASGTESSDPANSSTSSQTLDERTMRRLVEQCDQPSSNPPVRTLTWK